MDEACFIQLSLVMQWGIKVVLQCFPLGTGGKQKGGKENIPPSIEGGNKRGVVATKNHIKFNPIPITVNY
jgi:hypothetical protein